MDPMHTVSISASHNYFGDESADMSPFQLFRFNIIPVECLGGKTGEKKKKKNEPACVSLHACTSPFPEALALQVSEKERQHTLVPVRRRICTTILSEPIKICSEGACPIKGEVGNEVEGEEGSERCRERRQEAEKLKKIWGLKQEYPLWNYYSYLSSFFSCWLHCLYFVVCTCSCCSSFRCMNVEHNMW